MNAKALLIPLAAFAVTVTGVQAFNSDVLEEAGLTEDQISAFEEARELRQDGDREGARDTLVEAGVDEETLKSIREAMQAHRNETHNAVEQALENNDFGEFKIAAEGSPLADIITSEDDFTLFKEAHDYREEGDYEAAREIMDELGMAYPRKGMGMHRDGRDGGLHVKSGFGEKRNIDR